MWWKSWYVVKSTLHKYRDCFFLINGVNGGNFYKNTAHPTSVALIFTSCTSIWNLAGLIIAKNVSLFRLNHSNDNMIMVRSGSSHQPSILTIDFWGSGRNPFRMNTWVPWKKRKISMKCVTIIYPSLVEFQLDGWNSLFFPIIFFI